MATQKFTAIKMTDAELFDAFSAVASLIPQLGKASLNMQLAESGAAFDARITELDTSPGVQELRAGKAALLHRASLSGGGYAIAILRGPSADEVTVTIPDQQQPETQKATIKFLTAVHDHFRAYGRTAATDEVLGRELAEFYRQREELLTRLERVHTEIVEANEAYRHRLEESAAADRQKLETEFQRRRDELDADHKRKEAVLSERESALQAQIAKLDDRSSTHARRDVRQELKKIVAERTASFHLSRDTVRKRAPVHTLFIVLILASGTLFALALLGRLPTPTAIASWLVAFRMSVIGAAFAAAIIFYIRWADHWFRQHADEEMRLKRLELDLDRATWVVEMALEWKREKDSDIPQELVDRLSRNLFESDASSRPRHPGEELASALLGASSGLSINLPGVGEAKFDRKGIQQFKDAVAKHTNEG
ncbi:MAG TPA: hypothetical protein VEK57_23900 [Thermoanaerobaculia bacterium]|nr:hypothetical protein [Thermoanaerobaculia bacterium]